MGRETCVSGGTQTWSLASGMLDLWNRGGVFQRKNKAKPICFYMTGRDFLENSVKLESLTKIR